MGEGRVPEERARILRRRSGDASRWRRRTRSQGAVKLANEKKLAIVVLDPDGVWKKEWGELYRVEEGDEEEAGA